MAPRSPPNRPRGLREGQNRRASRGRPHGPRASPLLEGQRRVQRVPLTRRRTLTGRGAAWTQIRGLEDPAVPQQRADPLGPGRTICPLDSPGFYPLALPAAWETPGRRQEGGARGCKHAVVLNTSSCLSQVEKKEPRGGALREATKRAPKRVFSSSHWTGMLAPAAKKSKLCPGGVRRNPPSPIFSFFRLAIPKPPAALWNSARPEAQRPQHNPSSLISTESPAPVPSPSPLPTRAAPAFNRFSPEPKLGRTFAPRVQQDGLSRPEPWEPSLARHAGPRSPRSPRAAAKAGAGRAQTKPGRLGAAA